LPEYDVDRLPLGVEVGEAVIKVLQCHTLGDGGSETGSARRERSQQPSWRTRKPNKVELAERATLSG
jgi:hypothetical protein